MFIFMPSCLLYKLGLGMARLTLNCCLFTKTKHWLITFCPLPASFLSLGDTEDRAAVLLLQVGLH